jgi:hypothetical protein
VEIEVLRRRGGASEVSGGKMRDDKDEEQQ